jgi:Bacterial HORMA domain family 1
MSTYTVTKTGARELAGKVAADLRQFARFYGQPTQAGILAYLVELEFLLERGLVESYKFGFRSAGRWVVCFEYTVQNGAMEGGRPGGIDPDVNVTGATYYNYLNPSGDWYRLTPAERAAIEASLPVQRTPSEEPGFEGGSWYEERTYGAGGVELKRRTYRR